MTAPRYIPGFIGVALIGVHALLVPTLLDTCRREELRVRVVAPRAAAQLSVQAILPAGIYDRTQVFIDGEPGDLATADVQAGIHRVEWAVSYRGGFERRVGITQIVGPFQDAENPPCSVRLLIHQNLVDDADASKDKEASKGTIAYFVKQILERNMESQSAWHIGDFKKLTRFSMVWDDARDGSLVVKLQVEFSRVVLPLKIVLVPTLNNGTFELKAFASADLNFPIWVPKFVLSRLNSTVAAIAEDEVQTELRRAFLPPPPVPLPGGRKLVFDYCPHQDLEIVAGMYAALPLAIRIEDPLADILPVSFGPIENAPIVKTDAQISLEFNIDALNLVLYYLWRTDFLDQELEKSGVNERFNENSIVQDMLSIRIGDIKLSLPPTASLAHKGASMFELGAEAALLIHDGERTTRAHVFGRVGVDFAGNNSREVVAKIVLSDLSLTCEPEPGLLQPCYSDLVAQVKTRSDELHGELTRLFTKKFNAIVLGQRVGTEDMMANFKITGAEVHAKKLPPTGVVRVDLFGTLTE